MLEKEIASGFDVAIALRASILNRRGTPGVIYVSEWARVLLLDFFATSIPISIPCSGRIGDQKPAGSFMNFDGVWLVSAPSCVESLNVDFAWAHDIENEINRQTKRRRSLWFRISSFLKAALS